ncbi:MAG: MSCRAMM family adhesin SdrC [Bacteroidales bacterium]|nr:MSCRAMM family adhesin SdrC [Bacteroidales bacterium]
MSFSLLKTGVNLASGLLGGLSASKALKKAQSSVKSEITQLDDWYQQRYNETATERADARALLSETSAMLKDSSRRAAARSAVVGSTPEQEALSKSQSTQALAQTVADISSDATSRKDQLATTYQSTRQRLMGKLQDLYANQGKAWQQALASPLA